MISMSNFHTIKSILNMMHSYNNYRCYNHFHTIKSILNLINNFIYDTAYNNFHTIKSILNKNYLVTMEAQIVISILLSLF